MPDALPAVPTAAPGTREAAAAAAPDPALAWSATRRRRVRECERAYYWHYVGSADGWQPGVPVERRRAFALKHLTSLPQLLGTVVHNAARDVVLAVRDGRAVPTLDELLDGARRALNQV